jgi:hypothetical protein
MNQKAIDRLFDRLSAIYGAAWDRSLGATPVLDAKSIWAHELQAYGQRLEAVVWALDQMPENPPNVIQFRNLCRQAPAAAVPCLPEPQADPARMAAELAKLGQLRTAPVPGNSSMRGWAHRLAARDAAGDKLSHFARAAYKSVLGRDPAHGQTDQQPQGQHA